MNIDYFPGLLWYPPTRGCSSNGWVHVITWCKTYYGHFTKAIKTSIWLLYKFSLYMNGIAKIELRFWTDKWHPIICQLASTAKLWDVYFEYLVEIWQYHDKARVIFVGALSDLEWDWFIRAWLYSRVVYCILAAGEWCLMLFASSGPFY